MDDHGRSDIKIRRFKGNLDNLGQRWTVRRVLQNRRLQVRFLSHLPHFSLISCGLERLRLRLLTAVRTKFLTGPRRNPAEIQDICGSKNTDRLPKTACLASNTAGRGRASRPTCPENPEFTSLAASQILRNVCALTPNFIPPGATPLVSVCGLSEMDFPVHQIPATHARLLAS